MYDFDYASIRAFTVVAFNTLAKQDVPKKHIAMTIHVMGFGLDETESLMAQIGGIIQLWH